jgi:hypothetical protein
MEFGLAFRYAIDRNGGWTNILLVTVCFLIPIVGPIVMMGYRAEVAEALIRDPDLRRHPLFKFDRFAEYLSRGVWAFLIALIVSIPLMVLIFAAMMIGMMLDMQQAGGRGGPPVMTFVLYGIAYAVGLPLTMAFSIPMTFHAELTARFDLPGAYRFAISFWKLIGGKALVAGIVFMILSTLLTFVGLLLCCVGVYPATAIASMAAQHLMVQLYLEYLNRGGEPLVRHDLDSDVVQEPESDEDDRYDD